MKRACSILILALICVSAFAQLTQKELNDRFGAIRAEIVKSACKIAGYELDSTINKIAIQNLNRFYNDLDIQGLKNKKIQTFKIVIGNMGNDLGGTDINVYKSRITNFKDELVKGLLEKYRKKKDDINKLDTDFSGKIAKLVENCQEKEKEIAEKKRQKADSMETARQEATEKAAEEPKKPIDTIKTIVYVVVIVLLFAFLLFKKKKQNKMKQTDNSQLQQTVTQPQSAPTVEPVQQPTLSDVTPEQQPTPAPAPPPPQPAPQPPVSSKNIAFSKDADEWIVVGASVTGKGHIATQTPCQDSHKYEYLGDGWGIAVISDGAGSAANSHIGSKIVAERTVTHFKNLITGRNWIKKNELPTEMEWAQIAFATLKTVRGDMAAFAKKQNIELKSLYATAIAVIHTPEGILATHIGDGRAGYKNEKGEWKALIIPHKGEEANQTIFVPSDFWDIPAYKMSGVLVPESVVIKEKPFAFTLMSDGCETTSWLYNQHDEKTGRFFDPNKPYPNFFNPLDETLQSFRKDEINEQERADKWKKFIESGNPSFVKETDDKTMILGVVYM